MIDLKDVRFKSTLKDTSKDTSDLNNIKYMTDSCIEVVNFDTVKTVYLNDIGLSEECASSVDALIEQENVVYFIEFKNGKLKSSVKRDIKDKVRDSLLFYDDIKK